MPRIGQFVVYWVPLLVWMALIFTASADTMSAQHSSKYLEPLLRWLLPRLSSDGLAFAVLFVRKCAHVTEYAILAVLAWRAIRGSSRLHRPGWNWSHAGLAMLIVILYAISDEIHQTAVPTRQGTTMDVLIDTAGGVLGLAAVWVVGQWPRSRRRRQDALPLPNQTAGQ